MWLPMGSCVQSLYIEKGRGDVDFPLDDYFMAFAVLAKIRSPYPQSVYIQRCTIMHTVQRPLHMYPV